MFDNRLFQNSHCCNNDVGMRNYEDEVNTVEEPINEGVQERCIHRTFIHKVDHICPIHTHIINHHVYRHTYTPQYTCSEENVCSNVECNKCNIK